MVAVEVRDENARHWSRDLGMIIWRRALARVNRKPSYPTQQITVVVRYRVGTWLDVRGDDSRADIGGER